jgi:hypothetical protein
MQPKLHLMQHWQISKIEVPIMQACPGRPPGHFLCTFPDMQNHPKRERTGEN